MILVTGATGFLGRHIVARLAASGCDVCCLVRPAYKERRLPAGVRVNLAAGDLSDLPALRVALHRVEAIVHLASIWVEDSARTFESVNYRGTLNLIEAAQEVGVRRMIFMSHPCADGHSAYAFLRHKGMAEEAVKTSGMNFTIMRPSWVYGPGDGWTTHAAMVLRSLPVAIPVIGDGQTRMQPLWVQDLALCVERCLADKRSGGRTINLGGPGYLTFGDALDAIAKALSIHRPQVHIRMPLAYSIARSVARVMPQPLLTTTFVDLLNVDSTTDLGSVPRNFGFEPARFADSLSYLVDQPWRRRFWGRFFRRRQLALGGAW